MYNKVFNESYLLLACTYHFEHPQCLAKHRWPTVVRLRYNYKIVAYPHHTIAHPMVHRTVDALLKMKLLWT